MMKHSNKTSLTPSGFSRY